MLCWLICAYLAHTLYVVRHHERHIMSEKKYFSFWQIWILQILSFKSIYNLPYFIVRKIPKKHDRKLESCMAQFSFPHVFLAFWAFMISDFIRVTWSRTTYVSQLVTRHMLRRQLLRHWYLSGDRVRLRGIIGFLV